MRSYQLATLCMSLGLAACQQAIQGENTFRSPLVVGYTDGTGGKNALSQVYAMPTPQSDGAAIRPGECIAIFLHEGVISSASETGADRLVARAMKRGVVAEWQMTTTVSEQRREAESIVETTLMPSTMVFQRQGTGVRPERMPYRNMPIYGPRQYHGGPITIKVALTELDEKETEKNQALVNDAYKTLREKALPPITMADVLKESFVSGASNFVKLGTGQYVALGIEAAKLAWNVYTTVHKPDDIWLDESEGWLPAHYLGSDRAKADRLVASTGGRVLKTGIWTLVRAPLKVPDHTFHTINYDPRSPSRLTTQDTGDAPGQSDRPTFLALRFASYSPLADGKCTQ